MSVIHLSHDPDQANYHVMTCGKDDLTKKSQPGINGTYHAEVGTIRYGVIQKWVQCQWTQVIHIVLCCDCLLIPYKFSLHSQVQGKKTV